MSITIDGSTNEITVAGSVTTGTGGLVRATSPSLVTPKATTTLGVGNATPAASGAGITFPATQSYSTNANTLDDYEEGDWTPAITFGGAAVGVTYNALTGGKYVKKGREVSVTGYLYLTSKGSSVGSVRITGLPFTNAATDASVSPVALYFVRISFANMLCGSVFQNTSTIDLIEVTEAGTQTDITDSDFQNNSWINVSATYFI